MENWENFIGEKNDPILSSRIRIARNINNKPFPHKLSEEDAKQVIKQFEDAFYVSNDIKDIYKTVNLRDQDQISCVSFFERHLISRKLINNRNKSAFVIGEKETVSIMLNEEDHIRFQCIVGGANLRRAFDTANKLDDLIEENIEYAFDEKLGYITACPTNLGSGLRASMMIHLPALTMNNEIEGILKALTQIGMTIRGLYGEGSNAMGNIYQISNQVTLGVTEEDILNNLEAVVNQIVNQENITKDKLLKTYKYELEDKIFRSLGILKNVILLNLKECMDLLSNVRMGVEMGIIKDISKVSLNQLLVEVQPASMEKACNKALTEREQDLNRAKLVRKAISI